jgi:sec-independent protein translocase protein TatC
MKPLADIFDNRDQVIAFLEKLRRSLIQMAVVVFGLALAGYVLARDILNFLQELVGVTLAYYALTETFFALLNIALAVGLIASAPFFLYQVLSAVQAVFSGFTARMKWAFWLTANGLFYLGAGFCLFITLPYGAKFLLGFQNQSLEAVISVQKFVSFSLTFIIGFGIVFELPLLMVLLGRIGVVKISFFTKYRSYAFLVIAIVAAVVTPTPDAVNMMLMVVPLYILYEIGIIGMRIGGQRPSSD